MQFASTRRSEAQQLEMLQSLVRSKRKIVVFSGFGTAGKTWIMLRLLQEFRTNHSDAIVREDSLWPKKSQEERIFGTGTYGQSHELFFHDVNFQDGVGSFTLVDMVGEQFNDLAQGHYENAVPTIAALLHASQLILALPTDGLMIGRCLRDQLRDDHKQNRCAADDLRLNRDARLSANIDEATRSTELAALRAIETSKRTKQQRDALLKLSADQVAYRTAMRPARLIAEYLGLEEFGEYMANALQTVSYAAHLDREGTLGIFESGFAAEKLRQVSTWRQQIPLAAECYVALTKADTLLPLIAAGRRLPSDIAQWEQWADRTAIHSAFEQSGWADTFRQLATDPRMAMALANQTLFNQLNAWLRLAKVDWASADWSATSWDADLDSAADTLGIDWIAGWIRKQVRDESGYACPLDSVERVALLRRKLEANAPQLIGWGA